MVSESQTPNDTPLLQVEDVQSFLSRFQDLEQGLGPKEVQDTLLQASQALPGVDSALLVLLNNKEQTIRFSWLGLDGELAQGDTRFLEESPWRDAFAHGELWWESQREETPLPSLPPVEEPFQDRCLLPIKSAAGWHSLVVLQSNLTDLFSQWDHSLLSLMTQQIGQMVHCNERILEVAGALEQRLQQSAQSPSSLEGILETSRSVVARTNPIATYVQYNLDTLQVYLRTLQETLDYYIDEIKLNATQEGLERVQQFAQQRKLDALRTDLESLVEDSSEGIFQLRYFLQHIRELHYPSSMSEQLSFDDILDPVFPLVFSHRAVQIERPPLDGIPVYGNRTKLQQALLMLFFHIQQKVSTRGNAPHISIAAHQAEGEVHFQVAFAVNFGTNALSNNQEELLFLQQVMEEHQGTVHIDRLPEQVTVTLSFPAMFAEEAQDDPQVFSMEAMELPALESSDEIIPVAPQKIRHKILFVGTAKRLLRAIRRVLSASFEIFLASSQQSALDILQANSDIALVLCDLQEGEDEIFALLEEIQTRDPQLVSHICFLVGEKMSSQAEELANRVSVRTISRHVTPKELELFVQRRARLL